MDTTNCIVESKSYSNDTAIYSCSEINMAKNSVKIKDIWMRDPFIHVDKTNGNEPKYILYGTTDKPPRNLKNPYDKFDATGFDCYTSVDLVNWEGPITVFEANKEFWADTQFWAPEVYNLHNQYFMLATFNCKGSCRGRGVQILRSSSPYGPFLPHTNETITPKDWECLDGTLCWQEPLYYMPEHSKTPELYREGGLFMVFCKEFLQVGDGEMWVVELSIDLKTRMGKPIKLFNASHAPWVKSIGPGHGFKDRFITDGPFIYRMSCNKELILLWSSMVDNQRYGIGICRSTTGHILGPWVHDDEPLYVGDGGHCMIFVSLEGNLMISLHTPNKNVWKSKPKFLQLEEQLLENGAATLRIINQESSKTICQTFEMK